MSSLIKNMEDAWRKWVILNFIDCVHPLQFDWSKKCFEIVLQVRCEVRKLGRRKRLGQDMGPFS